MTEPKLPKGVPPDDWDIIMEHSANVLELLEAVGNAREHGTALTVMVLANVMALMTYCAEDVENVKNAIALAHRSTNNYWKARRDSGELDALVMRVPGRMN